MASDNNKVVKFPDRMSRERRKESSKRVGEDPRLYIDKLTMAQMFMRDTDMGRAFTTNYPETNYFHVEWKYNVEGYVTGAEITLTREPI